MNRKLVAITGALKLSLGACTPAQTALYNLSSMSEDLMSNIVEEDWMVLV